MTVGHMQKYANLNFVNRFGDRRDVVDKNCSGNTEIAKARKPVARAFACPFVRHVRSIGTSSPLRVQMFRTWYRLWQRVSDVRRTLAMAAV